MNSSHTPVLPLFCMGCWHPFQALKSPTTLTRSGIGRPHGKMYAFFCGVCAEAVVDVVVIAFAVQVQVKIA